MTKTYIYRECSQNTADLDIALAKAQGEFTKVIRNREGPYGMFADLAAMETATKAALSKNGLAITQTFVEKDDHSMSLVTELSKAGQFKVSSIHIPFFTNPQHTHSYCTYMARLGYSRILCLAVDEADDGESLAGGETGDGGDIAGIEQAVKQATTTQRLDELWRSVKGMKLPAHTIEQLEEVFGRRAMEIKDQPPKKKEKPNADTK